MKLDQLDLSILKRLQENGKITNLQLSKDIGLSPAPTLERVKKLESKGYILSYHAVVDDAKLELGITAFMKISLISQREAAVESFINKIKETIEVLECYKVTGQADYLLKIMVKDIVAYDIFVKQRLMVIDEIKGMSSIMVISKDKHSKVLPYEYKKNIIEDEGLS
jgi:Lrp/AsnC family leucine-responsive transcriptional regulator